MAKKNAEGAAEVAPTVPASTVPMARGDERADVHPAEVAHMHAHGWSEV